MNPLKYIVRSLPAVLLFACTDPEQAPLTVLAPPVIGQTQVTLQGADAPDVTVYAFRRSDDRFLYDTVFRDGWDAAGRMSVRMRNGQYKFLFVKGTGAALAISPVPPTKQTAWEEVEFALAADGAAPGFYLPADELYLQYPADSAETVYAVQGEPVAVRARLARAVGQVGITLKRGYRDGEGYVEVPYGASSNVLQYIAGLRLTVAGVGQRVMPAGPSGTVTVSSVLDVAGSAALTPEGFARIEGPFLIPAAAGTPVAVDVDVIPADGSPVPPTTLRLEGPVERNKRLEITLWLTSDYPALGVEVDLSPIDQTQDGDTGVWE